MSPKRFLPTTIATAALLAVSACGGQSTSTAPANTAPADASAPAASSAPATTKADSNAPAVNPCEALTPEEVTEISGVQITGTRESSILGMDSCDYQTASVMDGLTASSQSGPMQGTLDAQMQGVKIGIPNAQISKVEVAGAKDARIAEGTTSGVPIVMVAFTKGSGLYLVTLAHSESEAPQVKDMAMRLAGAMAA